MCFAYLFHCVNMRNYWCFCIMTDTCHDAKRYCHLVQHANMMSTWCQGKNTCHLSCLRHTKKIHRKHDKSSWAWWLCWRNSYASGVCNIIKRRQIMVSPFKMNVELKQYGIKVGWGFVVWYSVLYMLRVMSRKNMSFASRLMTYFFCSWHSAYTESHITPLTPSYLSNH